MHQHASLSPVGRCSLLSRSFSALELIFRIEDLRIEFGQGLRRSGWNGFFGIGLVQRDGIVS